MVRQVDAYLALGLKQKMESSMLPSFLYVQSSLVISNNHILIFLVFEILFGVYIKRVVYCQQCRCVPLFKPFSHTRVASSKSTLSGITWCTRWSHTNTYVWMKTTIKISKVYTECRHQGRVGWFQPSSKRLPRVPHLWSSNINIASTFNKHPSLCFHPRHSTIIIIVSIFWNPPIYRAASGVWWNIDHTLTERPNINGFLFFQLFLLLL